MVTIIIEINNNKNHHHHHHEKKKKKKKYNKSIYGCIHNKPSLCLKLVCIFFFYFFSNNIYSHTVLSTSSLYGFEILYVFLYRLYNKRPGSRTLLMSGSDAPLNCIWEGVLPHRKFLENSEFLTEEGGRNIWYHRKIPGKFLILE